MCGVAGALVIDGPVPLEAKALQRLDNEIGGGRLFPGWIDILDA
jgi:hypothetical protein